MVGLARDTVNLTPTPSSLFNIQFHWGRLNSPERKKSGSAWAYWLGRADRSELGIIIIFFRIFILST